jgi:anti-anti-sigma regulatory factor
VFAQAQEHVHNGERADGDSEPMNTKDRFTITEFEKKDSASLTFRGKALEAYHCEEFQEACDQLLERERKYLILDLRNLENIRSRFIGIIIKLADDARQGDRRLAVVATKRVNQMLGMFASDVGLELKTEESVIS